MALSARPDLSPERVDAFPLHELVTLLRCPRCHGPADLVLVGDGVECPGCLHHFDLRRGVPVLLAEDRDVPVMPDDHESNQINDSTLEWLESLPGYSLNLGAGATRHRPKQTVEVEYAIFRNTTAVANAHNLPFKDAVFDAVVSFNTFEHLADPRLAARELHRVLKPNGRLILQTAFLQPLHEGPFHFYNATEFGVRQWFADFDIEECIVPDNMSPVFALAWIASTILHHARAELGEVAYRRLRSVPLEDWEAFWGSENRHDWGPADALSRLSQSAQSAVSFGFEVRARKQGEFVVGEALAPLPDAGGLPLAELLSLLRCPCCHGEGDLVVSGDLLACPGCSRRFRLERGVPILLCEDRDVRVMPEDHRSNPIDSTTLDWLDSLPGYSLNLGAGSTQRRPSRCVEVEYSLLRNTTAVADAHNLPFKDAVFDAVVSFSTFEHLSDPTVAAKEIYRVLKPGGALRLQTAFLQPLHEEPAHYYNATEFGARHWFTDFDIEDCFVPDNMTPAYTLAWLSNHILWHIKEQLGREISDMVGQVSIGQWARYWEEPTGRNGFMPAVFALLPPSVSAHFAAGFEIRAARRGSVA
jgi:ubiquinone/menaquinone biosynthesis C-methylase UbiE/uncharacterized protein YbaR (Trm112 family)